MLNLKRVLFSKSLTHVNKKKKSTIRDETSTKSFLDIDTRGNLNDLDNEVEINTKLNG